MHDVCLVTVEVLLIKYSIGDRLKGDPLALHANNPLHNVRLDQTIMLKDLEDIHRE